tara:strand:- start:3369 stop:4124 length:756 start_codon:yes stop_codon:yes gene_type:complete
MSKIIVDEIQTNTVNGNVRIIPNGTGELEVTGNCSATTFSGSGASLTSLPSANLTGALPAIDGSALTGIATGGGMEFVKKINPVSGTTFITETGLEYDTVYKLIIKSLSWQNYDNLSMFPHVDNSTSMHSNGDCNQGFANWNGSSLGGSGNNGFYLYSNMTSGYDVSAWFDFYTGSRFWIKGQYNVHYNAISSSHTGYVIFHGTKTRGNNTNNDPNQTSTYSKVNGFTFQGQNASAFDAGSEWLLYKYKES